ncbi:MAG: tRNA 2-thiouridine(34) synthase MnmA [Pseudomonadales bacterium]
MSAPASTTVIVGMSGGVDSSVSALLLKRAGYRVEGLFMKNWEEDDGTEYCTAKEDLADAEAVCTLLDIPLHTANFAAEYWDNVFEEFLAEYAAGRTPNPDVLCNREIKFKQFARYALALGGDLIATGHYARGTWTGDGAGTPADPLAALAADPDARGFRLRKGADAGKDQTYFLHAVPRAELARCLFPLGTMQKKDVRRLAGDEGLHVHRKKDSTGICFIGERRFRDFLQRYLPERPGEIFDPTGRRLGEHPGLAYYTLGQRQGLGIGGQPGRAESPWYVAAKDLEHNALVVTQEPADLDGRWLVADRPNWLVDDLTLPLHCRAKVRYRQSDQPCLVERTPNGRLRVTFEVPQRAITPGQYVCFYQADVCLGGALIEQADGFAARHLDAAGARPGEAEQVRHG